MPVDARLKVGFTAFIGFQLLVATDSRLRDDCSGGDVHWSAVRLALVAQSFQEPCVVRHGLCERLLREDLLGVNVGAVTRAPLAPTDLLRLSTRCLGITGLIADRLYVLAAGAARAGNTKVFLFAAPARDRDFLLFADQPTRLPDGSVVATAVHATTLVGEALWSREQQRDRERLRSIECRVAASQMSFHGVLSLTTN